MASALSQEHVIHAMVAVVVVIAATILRASGNLDNQTISVVYGTAVGYAAGRSGTGRPSRRASQEPGA